MKKTIVIMVALIVAFVSSAAPIWEENFDGLSVGTGDLAVNDGPVFGGTSPILSVGGWGVSSSSLSIADLGGGDHALRLAQTGGSRGAVVWLDTSVLGMVDGTTYTLQFTIDNWTLNGTSGTQADVFANVVRAKGIDTDPEGDATVTWDLVTGAGFDLVVAANGAEIATTHNQWQTSFNPKNDGGVIIDQSQFSGGSATFTYDFISNNSEYLGLVIGKADLNGEQPSFDVSSISIVPEPATISMFCAGACGFLFLRRRFVG